jgi:hypothetical protein
MAALLPVPILTAAPFMGRTSRRPFSVRQQFSSLARAPATSHSTTTPTHPSTQPIAVPTTPAHTTRRDLLTYLYTASTLAALSLASSPAHTSAKPSSTDPGDWSSPGLGTPVDPSKPSFVKLPSGVRFQELNVGNGPTAGPGDTVLFDYVLRRSNGYFIYGTVEGVSFQPLDVPATPVNAKLGGGDLISVGGGAAPRDGRVANSMHPQHAIGCLVAGPG